MILHSKTSRSLVLLAMLLVLIAAGCRSSDEESPSQPSSSAGVTITERPATQEAAAPLLPDDLTFVALVSKQQALPSTYAPDDLVALSPQQVSAMTPQRLRRPAAEALERLLAAARTEGLGIKVNSAYRSYQEQTTIFRAEVQRFGCSKALKQSAVPGHSEHQLGLAVDFTSAGVGWDLDEAFATEPEGRWLEANAARFGFVMSYPPGKMAVTGYEYEPWHFRYVSVPVAEAIRAGGKTPTEYFMSLGKASATISAPVTPGREPGPANCGQ
jgi:D-alanyl-D-alanine carboxypeptidase